jgi:hypothetical protein
MSALTADHLAALRAGLGSGMNARALTYKVWTSGVLGSAVSFSCIVTRRERQEYMREDGRKELEEIIDVRPLTTLPVRLGDQVIDGSTTYIIRAITGEDVQRLTCVAPKNLGSQSRDGLRSEGR